MYSRSYIRGVRPTQVRYVLERYSTSASVMSSGSFWMLQMMLAYDAPVCQPILYLHSRAVRPLVRPLVSCEHRCLSHHDRSISTMSHDGSKGNHPYLSRVGRPLCTIVSTCSQFDPDSQIGRPWMMVKAGLNRGLFFCFSAISWLSFSRMFLAIAVPSILWAAMTSRVYEKLRACWICTAEKYPEWVGGEAFV